MVNRVSWKTGSCNTYNLYLNHWSEAALRLLSNVFPYKYKFRTQGPMWLINRLTFLWTTELLQIQSGQKLRTKLQLMYLYVQINTKHTRNDSNNNLYLSPCCVELQNLRTERRYLLTCFSRVGVVVHPRYVHCSECSHLIRHMWRMITGYHLQVVLFVFLAARIMQLEPWHQIPL